LSVVVVEALRVEAAAVATLVVGKGLRVEARERRVVLRIALRISSSLIYGCVV
jgi:hypothetical protein